jgi:hypothetical protein
LETQAGLPDALPAAEVLAKVPGVNAVLAGAEDGELAATAPPLGGPETLGAPGSQDGVANGSAGPAS